MDEDFITGFENFMASVENEKRKKEELNRTKLSKAVINNDIVQMKKLISQGVDVNEKKDKSGKTALHWATFENINESHLEAMELLLKNGADINALDACGQTPFFDLVIGGSSKAIQLFLNSGADFHVEDEDGETPLFSAVSRNKYFKNVQLLLDLGSDVNHRCNYQRTPLHAAVENDHIECMFKTVEMLLVKGADINALDKSGRTPFFDIMKKSNLDAVKLFLSHNADYNIIDKSNRNLLFFAAMHSCDIEIPQLLINLGLNVNQRSSEGSTPLHYAMQNKKCTNVSIIKLLLNNGACLNTVDSSGSTPLVDSVGCGELFQGNLKFLLEHTDVNILNCREEHILIYADLSLTTKSREIILQHFAKLKILKIPIHQDILDTISDEDQYEYKEYYNKCIEELSRAKNTKILNSSITYFNLLVDNKKKLKNYASNEDLVKHLQKSYCEKKFPIHGAAMYENMKKGVARRQLFDKSAVSLSNYLPIFNSNPSIIRDVLDCVMSKKNLSKLCI